MPDTSRDCQSIKVRSGWPFVGTIGDQISPFSGWISASRREKGHVLSAIDAGLTRISLLELDGEAILQRLNSVRS